MAQRRGGDAKLRRRCAKVQVIGNGDECVQIGEIATIH
jgi:hypothetical protein